MGRIQKTLHANVAVGINNKILIFFNSNIKVLFSYIDVTLLNNSYNFYILLYNI